MKSIFLEIKELNKKFGPINALKNVSLNISQGEVICIIGPSGCGKSTLLRAINWLTPPDSGMVKLEGKIIVQSGDLRFVRSLKNSDLSRRCVLFNSYNLAASVLVSSALITHFKESPETDLVVIAGYGRFGQSMLALLHEKASSSVRQVVIIDQDAETQVSIAKEEEQSIEDFVVTVITGDVTHPTVWSEVAARANLSLGSPTVVLATGNAKANLNTAITLKNRYPNASLFTRTQEPNLFVDQVARDEGLNAFSIDRLVENGLPQRWM